MASGYPTPADYGRLGGPFSDRALQLVLAQPADVQRDIINGGPFQLVGIHPIMVPPRHDTKTTIEALFDQIKNNVEVMGLTIPEDKKKNVEKEKKAVEEKLVVLVEFKETVEVVEKFCNELKTFDSSLKAIDSWMMQATKELEEIRNSCDKMAPEDRVARTMDLQEDIAAKMKIIVKEIENEKNLLPQGTI